MKSNHICPYEKYYQQQAGSGIAAIYKGAPYQRGHGIGSFLGGLFRSILPLISTGAKVVGKEAMRAGVGLLNDVIEHHPRVTRLEDVLERRRIISNEKLMRKLIV